MDPVSAALPQKIFEESSLQLCSEAGGTSFHGADFQGGRQAASLLARSNITVVATHNSAPSLPPCVMCPHICNIVSPDQRHHASTQ